jgi:hypothetical protein
MWAIVLNRLAAGAAEGDAAGLILRVVGVIVVWITVHRVILIELLRLVNYWLAPSSIVQITTGTAMRGGE